MQNTHWIQGDNLCESPLFRRSFSLERLPVQARIEVCGLGYFHLYANGKRVGDQEFTPAPTNYTSALGCDTTYPVWEELSAYRCLYLEYDLLPYLIQGENVIGFHLGNGWFHQTRRKAEGSFLFGFPKLRYELALTWPDGNTTFIESDPRTLWKPSGILQNNLFYGEVHDLALLREDWCSTPANLSDWHPARPSHAPQTQLTKQECPPDKVLRTLKPLLLAEEQGRKLYDCGENIAGWVTIQCAGKQGEPVTVRYADDLTDARKLNYDSTGGERQIQEDCFLCADEPLEAHPVFCWHAFRYFEIEGPGKALSASVVCTDAPVTSSFRCSDPLLNWLYETYIRTQTDNYHGCIPSDCPHRERLGYTGDGQLTCETAMLTMDVKQLYDKWYQDILDSQGADTGHIPHTAPFLGGGGGPGGWGGAVYILPMAYHRIYGDTGLWEKGFSAVVRWLEYMDARSDDGLIVREEEGGWCLGEWCALVPGNDLIPAEFVNTFYYIQGLKACGEAAKLLGRQVPTWLEERIRISQEALVRTYYDPQTGDFCQGKGAANAFALMLHLGDARTKLNLIARYRAAETFDTGIFGTPILLEQLFREGESELAFRLLTNTGPASFHRMMQAGATTLWEAWDGGTSHNHPMFGSVVKLLFTEILGIRQREGSCGFRDFFLEPADIPALQWAEGEIRTVAGTIHVRWDRDDNGTIQIQSNLDNLQMS